MQQKWVVLSDTLKTSRRYHESRLSCRKLSERYYAGRAVIRETNESFGDRTILAYAALWPTNTSEWLELGTVWVCEAQRGNGMRHEIMTETVSRAPPRAKLFLITDVESVSASAEALGFVAVTTQTHPELLKWASELGIVTRLPESIHPSDFGKWGTPKAGERWLFMRA